MISLQEIAELVVEIAVILVGKLAVVFATLVGIPGEILLVILNTFIRRRKEFTNTLITGASRGVGRQFAIFLAKPNANLYLIARNERDLQEVKQACEIMGANVQIFSCDVTDRDKMEEIVQQCDEENPLDCIFANAGIMMSMDSPLSETVFPTYEVNVMGVLNTVIPICESMQTRRKGQIIIHASSAAYLTQRSLPFYSSSKAALLSLGEALRTTLSPCGVGVTVACSGFIDSDLVRTLKARNLPFSGLVSPVDATYQILQDAQRDYFVSLFPILPNWFSVAIGSLTPFSKQIVLDRNLIGMFKRWNHLRPRRF